jgi:hypothetical protein
MRSITSSASLKEAIIQLENRQKIQKELVQERLQTAKESLKPVNLIKNTFTRLLKSPKLIPAILMVSAGLTTSFFVKKKFSAAKPSGLNKIIGTILRTVTKAFFSELF